VFTKLIVGKLVKIKGKKMKKIILTSILGLSVTVASVQAKPVDLYVAAYGGSSQEILTKEVFPAFEKENNVKIHYSAGVSTITLAKLLSQKDNPDIDVAFIDDGPMSQAVALGMCEPVEALKDMPLHKVADFANGNAVGLGIIATGLTYNKDYFKKMGWDAPTSWYDLADPKYKYKTTFQSITSGYGLLTLIALNKAEGGTLHDMNKGLQFVEEKIKPIVKNYETSSSKLSEQFQSGEIVLAPWGSGRAYSLSKTGFNIGFVYPKEKAVALMTAMCVVKKNGAPKISQKLVRYMLSTKVQELLAQKKAWGPVNKEAKVSDELAKFLPTGENAKKIMAFDYSVINPRRSAWTKRWVRNIEN
jgi:putative spermidine/putrescine transport system substrate-binding protein